MPEVRTTSSTGGQKGVKLARFDLIPPGPLAELAEHYGRGARKYANHQWRQGYEWSKSIAALSRHFNDFIAGKDYDVCSNDPTGCQHVDAEGEPFEPGEPNTCFNHTGSHHMAAVAWHSFLLLEFKDTQPEHDDRYQRSATKHEREIWRLKDKIRAMERRINGEIPAPLADEDVLHENWYAPGPPPDLAPEEEAPIWDDFAFPIRYIVGLDQARFSAGPPSETTDHRTFGPDLLPKRRPIKDTPQA